MYSKDLEVCTKTSLIVFGRFGGSTPEAWLKLHNSLAGKYLKLTLTIWAYVGPLVSREVQFERLNSLVYHGSSRSSNFTHGISQGDYHWNRTVNARTIEQHKYHLPLRSQFTCCRGTPQLTFSALHCNEFHHLHLYNNACPVACGWVGEVLSADYGGKLTFEYHKLVHEVLAKELALLASRTRNSNCSALCACFRGQMVSAFFALIIINSAARIGSPGN